MNGVWVRVRIRVRFRVSIKVKLRVRVKVRGSVVIVWVRVTGWIKGRFTTRRCLLGYRQQSLLSWLLSHRAVFVSVVTRMVEDLGHCEGCWQGWMYYG